MAEHLKVEREEDVLTLSLNRPELRNALDESLIAELTAAVHGVAEAEGVRFVILRGEGKVFCAGADIDYMRRLGEAGFAKNLQDAKALGELFLAISSCPRPLIARVHGAAMGGGLGLVAAADLVVASEGARFGFTEVRLGLLPAVIAPYALRRIGPAACRRLFLTGESFDARRALDLGLVDEVVDEQQLDAILGQLLVQLRCGGPLAQTACKQLLDEISGLHVEVATERTPPHIARQRSTQEAREGLSAFLEKRSPRWAPKAESGASS